jgi:two-component system cell cycle response regulator
MNRHVKFGDLIPVTTRLQWMLACRFVLAVGVLVLCLTGTDVHGSAFWWLAGTVGWPVATALTLLVDRMGRAATRSLLTLSVICDGALLALASWAAGDNQTPVRYVIILHAVAVTLLASFRSGVRVALWHGMLNMLVADAEVLGLAGRSELRPWYSYGSFLVLLWTAVLGTASLAAMNERELRQRRRDSELLREFSLSVSSGMDATAVATALAEFARSHLTHRRAAVLVHVPSEQFGEDGYSITVVADEGGTTHTRMAGADVEPDPASMFYQAGTSRALLRLQIDGRVDRRLDAALPHARNVLVLPFSQESFAGVFAIEAATTRRSRRVERRMVETAEQAILHASLALERALLVERIRMTSETDGLTKVANRRRFDEVLDAEIARAHREHSSLALVLVDIDHFKKLNDTFGHVRGDEVLQDVARSIRAVAGEKHIVARYGGEEFAIIMPATDIAAAYVVAEQVRRGVESLQSISSITVSLGIAVCPEDGTDPKTLIAAADTCLYRSKRNGRNQVTVTTVALTAAGGIPSAPYQVTR